MAMAMMLSLVLLCGSITFARLGPPPRRRTDLRLRGSVLASALTSYALAAVALATDRIALGGLAIALAGELMCAVGWLGRGQAPPTDDDDDGGGGGGGGGGPKGPPSDWDAFEHAFRRYARERDRQPV